MQDLSGCFIRLCSALISLSFRTRERADRSVIGHQHSWPGTAYCSPSSFCDSLLLYKRPRAGWETRR